MRRYECENCLFYQDEAIVLPNGEIDYDDCAQHLKNDDGDNKEINDDGIYCEKFSYRQ